EGDLARCGEAVAAAGRTLPRVAAGRRDAVEDLVERLLVHLEPAAKGSAGAAAPRPLLDALDGAGRLADDHRALPGVPFDDRERGEREPGLRTGPTAAVVPLEGRERAVAASPPSHPGSVLGCLLRQRSSTSTGRSS